MLNFLFATLQFTDISIKDNRSSIARAVFIDQDPTIITERALGHAVRLPVKLDSLAELGRLFDKFNRLLRIDRQFGANDILVFGTRDCDIAQGGVKIQKMAVPHD